MARRYASLQSGLSILTALPPPGTSPQGGRSCTQAAHSARMRRAAPTRGAQWHLVSTPAYTELPRLSLKVSHLWGPYLSSWLVLLPDPPIQQSAVSPPLPSSALRGPQSSKM